LENKELLSEILDSMKEFKIIAYGEDEHIANKIMAVIKSSLLTKINTLIVSSTDICDYDAGYIMALEGVSNLIDDELS